MDLKGDDSDRPQRVLLTGATGFVGAFLADAFLRQGMEVVCLARSRSGRAARERVVSMLRQINPAHTGRGLHVVAGDITQPVARLSHSTRAAWRGKLDAIWHCAAETSFDALREDAFRTNVIGTENMLDVAGDLRVPQFHLISTAYVCGSETGIASEVPISRAASVRNVYEESKKEAEHQLLARAEKEGLVGTIFRLPVTMGHSRTGCTTQYLGYYYLAKAYFDLRRIFGRFIGDNLGVLLRIFCVPNATINVLPVDLVVETILCCLARPINATTIFHITNGTPPTVRFLYEETLRYFGMTVIEVKEAAHPDVVSVQAVPKVRRTEKRLRQSMRHYIPYLEGEPDFSRTNLERQIGRDALPNFTVGHEYLEKTLEYAVNHNWKRHDE